MDKIEQAIVELKEVKYQIDSISGLLCDIDSENADSLIHDHYMQFPTWDTIDEMILLLKAMKDEK